MACSISAFNCGEPKQRPPLLRDVHARERSAALRRRRRLRTLSAPQAARAYSCSPAARPADENPGPPRSRRSRLRPTPPRPQKAGARNEGARDPWFQSPLTGAAGAAPSAAAPRRDSRSISTGSTTQDEHGREQNAADDDQRQGFLHLRADAVGHRGRQQARRRRPRRS